MLLSILCGIAIGLNVVMIVVNTIDLIYGDGDSDE